jgi:integrase
MEQAAKIAEDAGLQKMEYAAMAGSAALEAAIKMTGVISLTVRDAIKDWQVALHEQGKAPNTIDSYTQSITDFANEHGLMKRMLTDVKKTHVDLQVNKQDGCTLSTKNLRLTAIKLFFAYHARKRRILFNPADEVVIRRHGMTQRQLIRRRTYRFTNEEMERLFKAAENFSLFWRFFLLFATRTGLRPVDLVKMEVENVATDKVVVVNRKTGKQLEFPMTPTMKQVVTEALADSKPGEQYLFPMYKGHNRYQLSDEFVRLRLNAGIAQGTLRSLRKTAAQQTFENSRDELNNLIEQAAIKRAQELLGHSSDNTTRIHYLDLGKQNQQ